MGQAVSFSSHGLVIFSTSSEARNKAYCMACDVHFGIGHGGNNVVTRDIERDCHRTKASALSCMGGGIAWYVAASTEVDSSRNHVFQLYCQGQLAISDNGRF